MSACTGSSRLSSELRTALLAAACLISILLSAESAQAASSIELRGGQYQTAPEYWLVEDQQSGAQVTRADGWGVASVPPGQYSVTVVFRQPRDFAKWREVNVLPGQNTVIELSSGVEASGRAAQAPPEAWVFKDPVTGEVVAQATSRWGFLPMAPGKYSLTILLRGSSDFVHWGAVSVTEGQAAKVTLNSGIELLGGRFPPPPNLLIVDSSEGERVAQVRDRWGFLPLPPGRFALKVQFDATNLKEREIEIRSGQVQTLPAASFGLVQILDTAMDGSQGALKDLVADHGLAAFSLSLGDGATAAPGPTRVIVQNSDTGEVLAVITDPPDKSVWLAPGGAVVRVRRGGREKIHPTVPAGTVTSLVDERDGDDGSGDRRAGDADIDIVIQSPAENTLVAAPEVTVIGRAATRNRAGATQIVLVIDTSGSAADSAGADLNGDGKDEMILEAELAAANAMLSELHRLEAETPGTAFAVAIVRFSDTAEIVAPMTLMSDANVMLDLPRALDRVLKEFGGGNTHYDQAIDRALQAFDRGDLAGPRIILFMSDGKPSRLEPSFAAAARAGLKRVTIHAFGLGPDFKGALPVGVAMPPYPRDGSAIMAAVAELGAPGGTARSLPRPADIVTIVPDLPIVALARADIREVQVVNATTGTAALDVALSPDGSFQATVPVSLLPRGTHLTNTLVATAIAMDGRSTAQDEVTVRGELDTEQLLAQLETLKDALRKAEARIAVLEAEARQVSGQYARLQNSCADKDALIESLEAERREQQARLAQLETTIADFENRLADAERARVGALGEADALRNAAAAGQGENDRLAASLSKSDRRLAAARKQIEDLRSQRDALQVQMQQGTDQLGLLRSQLRTAEAEITRLTEDGEALRSAAGACTEAQQTTAAIPGRLSINAVSIEGRSPPSLLPEIELIFDASNSMWGQIDGKSKISIAKVAMANVIDKLPDDIKIGLRFYGHSVSFRSADACRDTELVYPISRIDKPRLKQLIESVQPRGSTPIEYALRQVADDFGSAAGTKIIVLVTDAKEECGGDPDRAVAALQEKGFKVILHIVGFALESETAKQVLEQTARKTGGRFFDVQDSDALQSALERSLLAVFEIFDASQSKITGGVVGQDDAELPPGTYTVIVEAAGQVLEMQEVPIVAGKTTGIRIRKVDQKLESEVIRP